MDDNEASVPTLTAVTASTLIQDKLLELTISVPVDPLFMNSHRERISDLIKRAALAILSQHKHCKQGTVNHSFYMAA